MKRETALLTFGIGPVHSFIAQARRIADVWAGSYLLSHLIRQAIGVIHRDADPDCRMIFPFLAKGDDIPDGLPNRFVCRVPAARAEELAAAMRTEVERVWKLAAVEAFRLLDPELAPMVSERLLDFSWSWISERNGYGHSSREGARQFAAARLFRPFLQQEEQGEKCAICGERSALPDGDRQAVARFWRQAQEKVEAEPANQLAAFLRFEQTRLCRVCATKRFFAASERPRRAKFLALDRFQPSDAVRYFAFVKMDGDRMGSLLGLPQEKIVGEDLEAFHREVSQALSQFAEGLRLDDSADLRVQELQGFTPTGPSPQLLYAGGDDVLLVCDPRDALDLVSRLRDRYTRAFEGARGMLVDSADRERFTISAAILFAHPGHPAGLLLHELEELLDEGAKERGGRNAVALRLAKRSGPPVEVAFSFSDQDGPKGGWLPALHQLIETIRVGHLTSGQSFNLRLEERTLHEVFGGDAERWQQWLADRLSRHEPMTGQAATLAEQVTPFFVHRRAEALRIARFLGREVER
jgi:CRISPR-associated protein Cmr2